MPADDADRALGASYRLIEKIGRGATGEVWRGTDRRTGGPVAAKLLRHEHVDDDDLINRFLRERSILTGLRHENIVAVRDLVVEGDQLGIVMEYVDGGSLRSVLRDTGPLPPGLALGVAAAVLDGLTAAHSRGVAHRDVKPDNVLVSTAWRELAPGSVKLSDFGIARIIGDSPSASTGLVGTPEYMAPEQLLTGSADFPVDVYGCGVLLYEMLAGRTPFAGEGTGYTVAHRHVTNQPPPLPLPDPIWGAVAGLLEKNPAQRPTARDAAKLLRELQTAATDLAALATQQPPEQFASAGGVATEVRGLGRPSPADRAADQAQQEAANGNAHDAADVGPDGEADAADDAAGAAAAGRGTPVAVLPDLGSPSQVTMVRSMPVVSPPVVADSDEPSEVGRRRWRRPWIVALVAAGALLVVGGLVWLGWLLFGQPAAPPAVTPPVRAQQQSTARPTGLVISRQAVWNPDNQIVQLTITFAAQRAALAGPFLQTVGPADGTGACPDVQWQPGAAALNRPSSTGVQARCGWAVQTAAIAAQQSASVTASVPLALAGPDPGAALQTWLDQLARTTELATTDAQVTSTAYAAQRLTDIQVVAPSRTVSGRTLSLTLLPVWPNGADELNPLMKSPPAGQPSSTLVAVAGGEQGVRFSDGCSGALSVSRDGLVVTALTVADQCTVNARVGNFVELSSNPFTITTRGS